MNASHDRRAFLRQLATLPLIGGAALISPSVAGEQDDALLLTLGAQLETVHAARAAFEAENPESDDDLTLYNRHWDLRENINRIAASTFAGLQVKAKAAQMALHHDPRNECEGDGSFLGLSNSLMDDILAMAGAVDA